MILAFFFSRNFRMKLLGLVVITDFPELLIHSIRVFTYSL